MSDQSDAPPRSPNEELPTLPFRRKRHHWLRAAVLVLLVLPCAVVALYTWSALSFVYARGERAGYLQKISRKGWICPTWEGELAMVNLPGAMPEVFSYTVRSDSIARVISANAGKHAILSYEQHRGVPSSCFGDTEYYIVGARVDQ